MRELLMSTCTLGPEPCAHHKRLLCVDCEERAWPIRILHETCGLGATRAITIVVVVIAIGLITLVWSGLEGSCVGLHDVNLRAPFAANLVRIAIVIATASKGLAMHISSGRRHEVHREVTGAAHFTQIHGEIDPTVQQLKLGDVLCALVVCTAYTAGIVMPHLKAIANDLARLEREVSFVHATELQNSRLGQRGRFNHRRIATMESNQ